MLVIHAIKTLRLVDYRECVVESYGQSCVMATVKFCVVCMLLLRCSPTSQKSS